MLEGVKEIERKIGEHKVKSKKRGGDFSQNVNVIISKLLKS